MGRERNRRGYRKIATVTFNLIHKRVITNMSDEVYYSSIILRLGFTTPMSDEGEIFFGLAKSLVQSIAK
jgi:hypothetical protein